MIIINLVLTIAALLTVFFCSPAFAGQTDAIWDAKIHESAADDKDSASSRFHGFLGAEINYAQGIINNAPYRGRLIPLLLAEYNHWAYIRSTEGGELGAWLLKTDDRNMKFGVGVRRHLSVQPYYGVPQQVSGMDTRRNSVDGVVNAAWRMKNNYLQLSYYSDIGNVSDGDWALFNLAHHFDYKQAIFDRDFRLVPSVSLEWDSGRLVDYYYGVRSDEAAPGRPAYTGRAAFIVGARLTGFLRMGRDTILIIGSQALHYGPGIVDSPIVTRSDTIRFYLGTVWQF